MKRDCNRLLQVLEDQIDAFQVLLRLLEKEKAAVVQADFQGFQAAAQEKENLLAKLSGLETERRQVVRALGDAFGEADESLTLRGLKKRLDRSAADRLESCRSTLSNTIRRVQEANRYNLSLMEDSLNFVRNSLSLLNRLMVSTPVYQRSGKIGTSGSSGRIWSGQI